MNNAARVRDVMINNPPTVSCGAALGEVVDALLSHGVTGLPVVDANKCVVGFVSEHDCIHTLLVSSYHCEGAPVVDDVMHSGVLSVGPDDSIVDLAQRMDKDKPKIYPVVSEGRLVGLVTRSAILKHLATERAHCD